VIATELSSEHCRSSLCTIFDCRNRLCMWHTQYAVFLATLVIESFSVAEMTFKGYCRNYV